MANSPKGPIEKHFENDRWRAFGAWVRLQRITPPNHFKQEEAAAAIGISRSHLSEIENGKVAVPKETVIKIAKALHCPKARALEQAGYKFKGSIDEKARLARILKFLKENRFQYAIEEMMNLYFSINLQQKTLAYVDGRTKDEVVSAISSLHRMPSWLRKELLDYFNRVQETSEARDSNISPGRKADALGKVREVIKYDEEKEKSRMVIDPIPISKGIGIGEDVHIAVVVKTSGPMPPDYSILSIEACVVGDQTKRFYKELKPLNSNAVPEAIEAHNIDMEKLAMGGADPKQAILEFIKWLRKVAELGRPVLVSDTGAFDWSFINWYTYKYVGANPFGFGAVDLRTYLMGSSGNTWGSMTSMEDTLGGHSMFWRNHGALSALDLARSAAEIFVLNTGRL